jgi:hypothetical protein
MDLNAKQKSSKTSPYTEKLSTHIPRDSQNFPEIIRKVPLDKSDIVQSLGKITYVSILHVGDNDYPTGYHIYTSEGFDIVSLMERKMKNNGIGLGYKKWKKGEKLLLLKPLPNQDDYIVRMYNTDRGEEVFGRLPVDD